MRRSTIRIPSDAATVWPAGLIGAMSGGPCDVHALR
jgi:hypothetical protein